MGKARRTNLGLHSTQGHPRVCPGWRYRKDQADHPGPRCRLCLLGLAQCTQWWPYRSRCHVYLLGQCKGSSVSRVFLSSPPHQNFDACPNLLDFSSHRPFIGRFFAPGEHCPAGLDVFWGPGLASALLRLREYVQHC